MTLLMANTFNWPNAIAQMVESYGLSSRELFKERGIPYPTGLSYSYKIELEELENFLHFLSQQCNDEFFILRMAQFFSPTMLDSFGVALMSSKNIEDAFRRSMNILGFLTDSVQFKLIDTEDVFTIQILIDGNNDFPLFKTMILGSTQKLLQILVSPDFRFQDIDFDFVMDAKTQESYEKTFLCPIKTQTSIFAFNLNVALLKTILPGANNELAEINEKMFYKRLNNSLESNIPLQVKTILLTHIPRGECSKEFVAKQLHITSRTLQYQLDKEGIKFKTLLESSRYEMAISYLRQNKNVTEIAHLLGYTDASNFCRAFKGWAGVSPKDFLG